MQERLDAVITEQGFSIAYANISDTPEADFGKIRLMGFGASDSSKILGVNPFNSRADILLEKITGEYDETISNLPNVRKGRELEPMILDKAEAFFDNKILKPVHMYGDEKGLLVNFDGVMLENEQLIPVEVKLCSIYGRKYYDFKKAEWEFGGNAPDVLVRADVDAENSASYYGVPVYYYTQLQQQIHFLGAPYGYLAAMDDKEWQLKFFKIPKNDLVIDEIVKETHIAQMIVEGKRNGRK